jgi:hypothetical protein
LGNPSLKEQRGTLNLNPYDGKPSFAVSVSHNLDWRPTLRLAVDGRFAELQSALIVDNLAQVDWYTRAIERIAESVNDLDAHGDWGSYLQAMVNVQWRQNGRALDDAHFTGGNEFCRMGKKCVNNEASID